jgi:hypothetical protein
MIAKFTQTALKCQGAIYLGLVKRGHIAVSLGGQIPVAGERPFEYRVVSFPLWE